MENSNENPWYVNNIDEFLKYCCPECDENYKSKEPFVLHALEKHTNAKEALELRLDNDNVEIVCKNQNELNEIVLQNNVIINNENKVKQDTVVKKEPKIYSCQFCDRTLLNYSNLQEHIKLKHGDFLEFECEICVIIFKDESRFKQHMSIVHENVKSNKSNTNMIEMNGETKEQILTTLHEKSKINVCEVCDKSFKNIHDLQSHISEKHKDHSNLKCNICKQTFEKVIRKIEHMAIVHEGVKNHICNICNKSFGWQSNLNDHIKSEHDSPVDIPIKKTKIDDKVHKWKCKICEKTFKKSFNLKEHVEAVHDGIKHKCEYCGKYFTRKSTLVEHKKIHTNITDTVQLPEKKLRTYKYEK